MNYRMRIITTTSLLIFNMYTLAEDQARPKGEEKSQESSMRKVPMDSSLAGENSPDNRVASVTSLVYELPDRGAPDTSRLVGAGTRANGGRHPYLVVLTPKHTGLTLERQPTLYWFTSESIARPLEFVLISNQSVVPVLKIWLLVPKQTEIQKVSLSDYDISLETETEYQWSVAWIPKRDMRSHDIVTSGKIKRINPTESLKNELASVSKVFHPSIYAKQGIWYDAIANLSDLMKKKPNNPSLREYRAQLLDQVELPQVAKYERNRGVDGR